jgi:hypothetical protein
MSEEVDLPLPPMSHWHDCWKVHHRCAIARVKQLQIELLNVRKENERLRDGMELAWGVIANAYGGGWELATKEWRKAAERWRDEQWHKSLEVRHARPTD